MTKELPDGQKPAKSGAGSQPKIGRRKFLQTASASVAAAGLGIAYGRGIDRGRDVDGKQGMDLPGERSAAGLVAPTSMRIPQGWRGYTLVFYEMSGNDPDFLEIYGYCDQQSYATGETVKLHITTTAPTFDIEIYRDGAKLETVYKQSGVKGRFTETPVDCYMNGCNWPVLHELKIPSTWRSGFYIVLLTVEKDGQKKRAEAAFVLRGNKKAKIAYLLTTCTWQAYNAWGGANHYFGIHGEHGDAASPILTFERPWERGFLVAAPNYPYMSTVRDRWRYEKEADFAFEPNFGWPLAMGYAAFAASAGWALDNRPFVIWAEENGYEMEYLAQTDLERGPEVLDGYDVVVITAHDEYWSWKQRDALDGFLENGGKMARFAANMLWQVRIEDNKQICYKIAADEHDPVRDDPARRHLLTGIWEHRFVKRPSAQTFGVTGLQGIYAAEMGGAPRSHAGFTVYRPNHWAFEGTGLMYGDSFGTEEGVVGYEVDSVDYTIRYGLPYPTDHHSPLPGTEILALIPSVVDQRPTPTTVEEGNAIVAPGDEEELSEMYARYYARSIEGKDDPETVDKYRYGSGQIVVAPKGKGEIFCAGTIYWFLGLKWKNRTVERITHNVLQRYSGKS